MMSSRRILLANAMAITMMFGAAGTAIAQTQAVVPNAYSATTGTATFLGPLSTAGRTYQLLINANQLTSLVGLQLNGLEWRLPNSATAAWPTADISFTNFDLRLSESVAPANRSLTFANNVIGAQTLVRSGVLNIPANTFPSGGSPNDFGFFISFDPYLYAGGHLLLELRHNGFTGTSRSVDAIGTAITGYGTDFSAAWTGSYTGTSGSQGNFAVTRFSALSTVPEPGSIILIAGSGLMGFAGIRLVRQRIKNRWRRSR